MTTGEQIARGLDGRRCGRGWKARCPAHEDHSPSLDIRDSGGKVLVICRAGCPQDAVIAALRARGLWPERERPDRTPAEREAWARQQRDRRDAQFFAEAARLLAEECLDTMPANDPERATFTQMMIAMKTDAGMLSEYRDWRERVPELTAALVYAGRERERRLQMMGAAFIRREAEHAA